ncbi:MAG TPA: hypothetical protein ENI55_06365 [Alphaproteobacteria bacterium]|nr:hypothetical protein [Alphaproteobacteria bacterium]
MVNPQYPASLPQYMEISQFSAVLPDEFEETEMEVGPPRRDRVARGGEAERVKGVIWVDAAQEVTLKAFFRATLLGGQLAFDWLHPVTRAACTMEFLPGGLKYGNKSSIYRQYTLDLRILP